MSFSEFLSKVRDEELDTTVTENANQPLNELVGGARMIGGKRVNAPASFALYIIWKLLQSADDYTAALFTDTEMWRYFGHKEIGIMADAIDDITTAFHGDAETEANFYNYLGDPSFKRERGEFFRDLYTAVVGAQKNVDDPRTEEHDICNKILKILSRPNAVTLKGVLDKYAREGDAYKHR